MSYRVTEISGGGGGLFYALPMFVCLIPFKLKFWVLVLVSYDWLIVRTSRSSGEYISHVPDKVNFEVEVSST